MEAQSFGQLLRRLRMEAGLSQEALAERARMSAHAISSLERGARRAPYRDTVALLQDALDLAPPERELLAAAADSGRKRAPRASQKDPNVFQNNLPAQLTSFVGRDREVEEIARLLETQRLVTVSGPGGIGKTRVALETCSRMQDVGYDAMWFVDLAPLVDDMLVAARIATTVGTRLGDGDPARPLASALRGRVLMILDNCEHVIGTIAPLVTALLQSCPRLTLLATSRERLGIGGENVYRLAPLPATGRAGLLVQRSEPARPRDDAELTIAAAICKRLDGIPLALELAAARVPSLGMSGLRDRLDEHFKVLSRGSRTAPARQQTMQGAIAWSHDLLTANERALFRRLAIFAGGWRLDAAEAICAGAGLDESSILESLASLVEKSLVVADDDGPFGALRISRVDARVCIGATRRIRRASRNSGGACAMDGNLADWAFEEYQHIPQRRWSEYALPEIDNAYAAIDWARGEGNDVRLSARILAGLRGAFVDSAGSLGEFRTWVLEALERIGATDDPALHARLLRALMAVSTGAELVAAADRAIAICSELGDVLGLGRSLELQSSGYVEIGDLDSASVAIDRALTAYRDGGFGRSAPYAVALNTRANVFHHRLRFDEAERDHAEALAIAQVQEDEWFALHVQISRAAVALTANEPERAAALAESALAESRALQSPRYEMYARVNLAAARLALEDLDRAHEAAAGALRLARPRDPIEFVAAILYLATDCRLTRAASKCRPAVRVCRRVGCRRFSLGPGRGRLARTPPRAVGGTTRPRDLRLGRRDRCAAG